MNVIRHLSDTEVACVSPVEALLVEEASGGASHLASRRYWVPRGPRSPVREFSVVFLDRHRRFGVGDLQPPRGYSEDALGTASPRKPKLGTLYLVFFQGFLRTIGVSFFPLKLLCPRPGPIRP